MIETPGGLKRLESGDYVAPAFYEADSAFNTLVDRVEDAVPNTRTVNGKALAANITLTPADVGAAPTTRTVNGKALAANITLTPADVGAAPTSRTVNGKPLSSNIVLAPADVGAVPTTRTVNGKSLAANITLTPADVGAAGQGAHGPFNFPLASGVTATSGGGAQYWYTDTGLVLVSISVTIDATDAYKVIANLPVGFRPSLPVNAVILQDADGDYRNASPRTLYIRKDGTEIRVVSFDNTNKYYAGSILYAVER